MKKYLTSAPFLYIALLIISIFYIKGVLSEDMIEVEKKERSKQEEDVVVFSTNLQIWIENELIKDYRIRLDSDSSFNDLIEITRRDEGLTYEKTEYIHGTEYDIINNINQESSKIWNVYEGDQKITHQTKSHKIKNNKLYKMVLEDR